MSDESRAGSVVAESVDAVTDALDRGADEVDFETGAEAGRTLGARVGRELGGVVGRAAGGMVASGLREDESPREIADDVRQVLVDVLSALLRDADVDAALSKVRETATDAARESAEDAKAAAEDAAADAETTAEDVAEDASPEELRDLQRETLRELLDVMSYEELQSVAKKVGVKANLDTETMRERIIEEFSGTDATDDEGEDGGEE